jgi:hypothetical protein
VDTRLTVVAAQMRGDRDAQQLTRRRVQQHLNSIHIRLSNRNEPLATPSRALTNRSAACPDAVVVLRADTGDVSRLSPEDEEAVRRFAAWKHRRKQPAHGELDMPTPQEVYAGLMKSAFSPALREARLRGSNGRFELPSDVYWAQLGFQKSMYSDGQEVRFTVNLLGVCCINLGISPVG